MMTNENCIKGAQAQGFMGRITTVDICEIARKTIDCALAGKAIYIPGIVNQALNFVLQTCTERFCGGPHRQTLVKNQQGRRGACGGEQKGDSACLTANLRVENRSFLSGFLFEFCFWFVGISQNNSD